MWVALGFRNGPNVQLWLLIGYGMHFGRVVGNGAVVTVVSVVAVVVVSVVDDREGVVAVVVVSVVAGAAVVVVQSPTHAKTFGTQLTPWI